MIKGKTNQKYFKKCSKKEGTVPWFSMGLEESLPILIQYGHQYSIMDLLYWEKQGKISVIFVFPASQNSHILWFRDDGHAFLHDFYLKVIMMLWYDECILSY